MNFRQRSNEAPSITPFGFTGIISQNSNLTVDKSYIEKGTSFINAFDNSNVILKDCGSPIPSSVINSTYVKKIADQIVTEKDSIKLPPWVHYKVKRYITGVNEYKNFNTKNKYVINVGKVDNVDETILKYRKNILNSAKYSSDGSNVLITSSDNMIEYQMNADGLTTDTISVTAPGTYVLSGVESSIRAVWPLNSICGTDVDSPAINLHFVNRELINFTNDNGEEIFISDIDKTDSWGNKKENENLTTVSTSPKNHKYIAEVLSNKISHGTDTIKINYNSVNSCYYLDLETVNDTKYIMGPYFNSLNYICYKKYSSTENLNEYSYANDTFPLTFYFKFPSDTDENARTYDLFNLINNKYDTSTNSDLSTLFTNYDFSLTGNVKDTRVYLNKFTEKLSKYQPDGREETCNFIGITLKDNVNSDYSTTSLANTIYYVDDSDGNQENKNAESLVLGFDKDLIKPENIKFYRSSQDNKTLNIYDSLSCVIIPKSKINEDEIDLTNDNYKSSENLSGIILSTMFDSIKKSYNFKLSCSVELSANVNTYTIPEEYTKTFKISNEDFKTYCLNKTIKQFQFKSDNITLNLTKIYNLDSVFKITNISKGTAYIQNDVIFNMKSGISCYTAIISNAGVESNITITKDETISNISARSFTKDSHVSDDGLTYSIVSDAEMVDNYVISSLFNDTSNVAIDDKIKINNTIGTNNDAKFFFLENAIINNDYGMTNMKKGLYQVFVNAEDNDRTIYDLSAFVDDETTDKIYLKYICDTNILDENNSITTYKSINKISSIKSNYGYTFNITPSYTYEVKQNKLLESLNNSDDSSITSNYSDFTVEDLINDDDNYNGLKPSIKELSSYVEEYTLSKQENFDIINTKISEFKETVGTFTNTYFTTNPIEGKNIGDTLAKDFADYYYKVKEIKTNETTYYADKANYTLSATFELYKKGSENAETTPIESTYYDIDTMISDNQEAVSTSYSDLTLDDSSLKFPETFSDINNNYIFSINCSNNNIQIKSENSPTIDTLLQGGDDLNETIFDEFKKSFSLFTIDDNLTPSANAVLTGDYKNVYITKNTLDDETTYDYEIISNNIKENNDSKNYYITVNGEDYYLYYNGKSVSSKSVKNDHILGTYTEDGDLTLSFNLIEESTEYKNLKLFFDESCKIPLEIDADTNNLYEHNVLGQKIYKDSDNKAKTVTKDGTILSYSYKPAYQFKFESDKIYYKSNFNDWYDIDTYVNYSYLNQTATLGAFTIEYTGKSPNYTSDYAILTGNTYFKITSNVVSSSVPAIIGSTEGIDNYNIDESTYNISSFFTNESSDYMGYKSFSFNFMIPESSWISFNDDMYAKNTSRPLSVLSANNELYKMPNTKDGTGACYEFSGVFIARYRNLKSGVQTDENAKGLNRYTTNRYTIPFIAKVKDIIGYDVDSVMFTESSTGTYVRNTTTDEYEEYKKDKQYNENDYKFDKTTDENGNETTSVVRYDFSEKPASKLFSLYCPGNNSLSFTTTLSRAIKTNYEGEELYKVGENYNYDLDETKVDNGYWHCYYTYYNKNYSEYKTYGFYHENDDGKHYIYKHSLYEKNVYEGSFDYNYFQFDWSRPDSNLTGKIQLNDLKVYVRWDCENEKLIISTLKEGRRLLNDYKETNGYDYFWIKNDISKNCISSMEGFINDDIVYEADKTFAKNFDLLNENIDFNNETIKADISNITGSIVSNNKDLSFITKKVDYLSSTYNIKGTILSTTTTTTAPLSTLVFDVNLSNKEVIGKGRYHHLDTCDHNWWAEVFHLNDDDDFNNNYKPYSVLSSRLTDFNNGIYFIRSWSVNPKNGGKTFSSGNDNFLDTNGRYKSKYIFILFSGEGQLPFSIIPSLIKVDGVYYEYDHSRYNYKYDIKTYREWPKLDLKREYYPTDYIGLNKTSLQNINNLKHIHLLCYKLNNDNYNIYKIKNNCEFTLVNKEKWYENEWAKITKYVSTSETIYDVTYKLPEPAPVSLYNILLGNLINNVKSSDNYFVTWMTMGDILYTDESKINNALPSGNTDFSGSGLLSAENWALTPINAGSPSAIVPYDISPYVRPFDMSTNLFYYKGSKPDNNKTTYDDNDEYLIINAKKMYNEIDEEDKKPEDGSLNLKLENLYDQELILTGIIDLGSDPEDVLVEQKFYRNKYFDYIIIDEDEDLPNSISSEYNIPVRYTDMREKAPQWLIYRLNSDVDFESVNNINIKVTPSCNNVTSNNKYDSVNSFEIPGRIKLRFNNLMFKQKFRQGVAFDNVKDIDFDQKLLTSSMFISEDSTTINAAITSTLSSRWNLVPLTKFFGDLKQECNAVGGRSLDEVMIADYVAKLLFHDYYLGGNKYHNDIATMNAITNSVNKWETIKVDSKYSDLFIFSDYSPNRVIGTPYLNMKDTLSFRLADAEGKTFDENGNVESYIQKAEIAKIATDLKVVNNINALTSIPTKYKYPENPGNYIKYDAITNAYLEQQSSIVYTRINKNTGYSSERKKLYDPNTQYGVRISAKITDVDLKGAVYFKIDNNTNVAEISNGEGTSTPGQFAIYFDGLLYDKQVYINENNSKFDIEGTTYKLLAISENTVYLSNDGTLDGYVIFQIEKVDDTDSDMIELHNIKPVSPSITNIGIVTDEEDFTVNNETWQKNVHINGNTFSVDYNGDDPYFSLQTYEDIRSEINEIKDDSGKTTKLFVKLKLKGLRKFKDASFCYHINNPVSVLLSSESMVEDYKAYGNSVDAYNSEVEAKASDPLTSAKYIEYDGDVQIERNKYFISGYNLSAQLGDTVMSGELLAEYNYIQTEPITSVVNGIGSYYYNYNPQGNNQFQIEVFKKSSGNPSLTSDLFYVNLPTDRWYNMSIYKYNIVDESNNTTIKYGLSLTDVTADSLEDVTSKSSEIFNVYTGNDKILEGLSPKCDVGDALSSIEHWVSSDAMYNYKSSYNVEFDSCSRLYYDNVHKSNDSSTFPIFSNLINITDDDYETYKGNGIIKISDALEGISFSNTNATISLFDNTNVQSILNTKFFNNNDKYHTTNYTGNTYFIGQNENKDSNGTNILKDFTPIKISYNGSTTDYYTLRKKDTTYHMKNVENMKVGSIMWISTPNLSINNNNCPYFDMYNESLNSVKEYVSYFGNPQHKLPPVNYTRKILDSDYATFVYNECEQTTGYKNIITVGSDESTSETIVYDYTNNPKTIAYVWDNSQVTRNETYVNGEARKSTLYWVESSNGEYTAEIGSIYNYTNLTTMTTNIVNITADAITDRQTTLLPIISTPLTFEKKSNEEGIVSVNDTIVATAALGYNSNGYPLNGVMVYNSNGSVSLDTEHTTYLYIAQNEDQSDCRFGGTQEKPIYVDTVQGNNAACGEKFEFVPNPYCSDLEDDADEKATKDETIMRYIGGNIKSNTVSYYYKQFFEVGTLSSEAINKEYFENLYYYGTIGEFDSVSIYNYDEDEITTYNSELASTSKKIVQYICNWMSITPSSEEIIKTDGFNVFYDQTKFDEKNSNDSVNKSWKTQNCFYFDGKLIPSSMYSDKEISNIVLTDNSEMQSIYTYLQEALTKNIIEIEPTMVVSWFDNDLKPTDYNSFIQNTTTDLSNRSGFAIFDNYNSCNLTGVKITINQEHLTSAPVWIKIYLLKAVKADDGISVDFKWINDASLDIDLRDTYEDEYDYESAFDKEIDHQFVLMPDNLDLTKNVFGIKFVIKQIVPQNNQYNQCIIDDIKIYASNILNKYGQSLAVEDIYVRKSDANCRNFYNMNVKEYVWQIPNSLAEWKTLETILRIDAGCSSDSNEKDDPNYGNNDYINKNAWATISGNLSGLSNRTSSTSISTLISAQYNENGKNFGLLNTYFITDGSGEGETDISTILSDNYMNDNENISITWKYVDYVYIYYSCDSGNSRFLLEKYFGNKIYLAVKAKLDANIESMNSNSAFKDKFTFSGGIAVRKSEIGNEEMNSTLFDWRSSTSNVYDWTAVYTTDRYEVHANKTVTRPRYSVELWNGREHSKTLVGYESTTTDVTTGTQDITTRTERLDKVTFKSSAVIENPKYVSTQSWTSSFEPIQIKYRID